MLKILLSSLLFLIVAPLSSGLRILIDLQETTATMSAMWTYDFPAGDTISFIWGVKEEATGVEVERDTTTLLETREWQHERTTADVAYLFTIDAYKITEVGWIPSGRPVTERYVIPARAPYVLVAETTETTRPDSIPHDPAHELVEGTLWLEFTPNSITGVQGLWSKDYSGFQTGGHLTISLEEGSLQFRIQSDSVTYSETVPNVVVGERNQVAVTFGPSGFNGWLNGTQVMSNPFTGGTVGNQNAIVVGANSWDTVPWSNALNGTMHTTELYDGIYDFSGRWSEPPIIPPPAICDTCVEVIRLSMARSFVDRDGQKWFQMILAPATYRYIDYTIGLTESFMYEVWFEDAKLGYSVDADYGVVECWKVGNGERCPVRPFQSSDGRPDLHVRALARVVSAATGVQLLVWPLLDAQHRGVG